jgi:hypothetical protein
MPNPGSPGTPVGLFYRDDTPEGRKRAEEFMRTHDRPGWGVFGSPCTFRDDADDATFTAVLKANGWRR